MAAGPDGDGPTSCSPASGSGQLLPTFHLTTSISKLNSSFSISRINPEPKPDCPPLAFDAGLTQAARTHAQAMLVAHQLSHQFEGEPSLVQRIATATQTTLDQEGENVAFDYTAEGGHKHLMLSPPHRANLLNTGYNVAGMGVIRSGDRLYIVQDFGHALPTYSPPKPRTASPLPCCKRAISRSNPIFPAAICSPPTMPPAPWPTPTNSAPPPFINSRSATPCLLTPPCNSKTFPQAPHKLLARHDLRSFSVGTCYARTETYPTGVYWVVLSLE